MQGVRWNSQLRNLVFFMIISTLWSNFRVINGAELSEDARSTDESSSSKTYAKKGVSNGLWFGPRLGKRSSDLLEQNIRRFLMEAAAYSGDSGSSDMMLPETLRNIYYTIEDGKPVDGLAGSKRRFTPRLGRESGEQEIKDSSRNVDFIPRLGRELGSFPWKYTMYPESDYALFGRSVENENRPLIQVNKIPPFSPRLGRTLALMLQPEKQDLKDPLLRIARNAEPEGCPKVEKTSKN